MLFWALMASGQITMRRGDQVNLEGGGISELDPISLDTELA